MDSGNSINQKTVSVVVPTYNDDEYLRRSINSVLDQSYSPIEVLIIDSGNSSIAATLERDNQNIDHIKSPPNGPAAARNVGISEAIGEYIAFLDADDEWYPQKILKQVHELENSEADFVFPNI